MSSTLVLAAASAGVAGWFTAEFCARPFCEFLRLRTAVRSLIVIFLHMPPAASAQPPGGGADRRAVSAGDVESAFRDLGGHLVAFGETEIVAAMAMEWLGFDPVEAGRLLIALSAIREGSECNAYVASIEEALRLTRSADAAREERLPHAGLLAGRRR